MSSPESSPPATPPAQATPAPPAAAPADGNTAKGSFVRIAIVVIWLLIAGMLVLLCYQWFSTHNPNSVLIVQGDERHDGASVRVEALTLKEPYVVMLTADNRYSAQFHMDGGTYTIRVERPGKYGAQVFINGEVQLPADQLRRIDLTKVIEKTEQAPHR